MEAQNAEALAQDHTAVDGICLTPKPVLLTTLLFVITGPGSGVF